MQTYLVVFEHDGGTSDVVVEAQDAKEAEHQVITAQGCTKSDIKSVTEIDA